MHVYIHVYIHVHRPRCKCSLSASLPIPQLISLHVWPGVPGHSLNDIITTPYTPMNA